MEQHFHAGAVGRAHREGQGAPRLVPRHASCRAAPRSSKLISSACACCVVVYTIYACRMVCMCVSGAAHSASAPKTRNGQNQRATFSPVITASQLHRFTAAAP